MAEPRKLHDRFFKQAKAEGYAARSAYKLKQIQEKRGILKKNDRVIDLGCAPGSWMQVASELVGPGGCVGGIDLKQVEIELPSHARTLAADIFKTDAATLLELATPEGKSVRLVDALLSDMAPNTEGGAGGMGDHFRSITLCQRVLELAPALLRPGGHLVMKVFEGEAYPDLLKDTQRMFAEVKGFKPEASRDVSREMYVVAKGLKQGARAMPSGPPPGIAKAPPVPGEGWGR